MIQGWNEGSSSHLIQTARLPEALKREVTGVFVGEAERVEKEYYVTSVAKGGKNVKLFQA